LTYVRGLVLNSILTLSQPIVKGGIDRIRAEEIAWQLFLAEEIVKGRVLFIGLLIWEMW